MASSSSSRSCMVSLSSTKPTVEEGLKEFYKLYNKGEFCGHTRYNPYFWGEIYKLLVRINPSFKDDRIICNENGGFIWIGSVKTTDTTNKEVHFGVIEEGFDRYEDYWEINMVNSGFYEGEIDETHCKSLFKGYIEDWPLLKNGLTYINYIDEYLEYVSGRKGDLLKDQVHIITSYLTALIGDNQSRKDFVFETTGWCNMFLGKPSLEDLNKCDRVRKVNRDDLSSRFYIYFDFERKAFVGVFRGCGHYSREELESFWKDPSLSEGYPDLPQDQEIVFTSNLKNTFKKGAFSSYHICEGPFDFFTFLSFSYQDPLSYGDHVIVIDNYHDLEKYVRPILGDYIIRHKRQYSQTRRGKLELRKTALELELKKVQILLGNLGSSSTK